MWNTIRRWGRELSLWILVHGLHFYARILGVLAQLSYGDGSLRYHRLVQLGSDLCSLETNGLTISVPVIRLPGALIELPRESAAALSVSGSIASAGFRRQPSVRVLAQDARGAFKNQDDVESVRVAVTYRDGKSRMLVYSNIPFENFRHWSVRELASIHQCPCSQHSPNLVHTVEKTSTLRND